jgi:hypothetical protein
VSSQPSVFHKTVSVALAGAEKPPRASASGFQYGWARRVEAGGQGLTPTVVDPMESFEPESQPSAVRGLGADCMPVARYCFTVITFVVITGSSRALAQDLPNGWRLPTPNEVSDEQRKDSPTRYAKATADFNGDGIADDAVLLKSSRYSAEALWVRLSTAQSFTWVMLDETKWGAKYPTVDLSMAVDVEPPGTFPYMCFDGAKDCNPGPVRDRPKLILRDATILYFKFESAASVFLWSYKYHRFLRVWLSD